MRATPHGFVVACTLSRLKTGSVIASTAAMRTRMCSGRHPAMTALIASFSMVASPWAGPTRATTWPASRPAASIMRRTRSSVGGTMGRPSVAPRS